MAQAELPSAVLPARVARYVSTGAPISPYRRDLSGALNQIPRWGWAGIGVVSAIAAYRAYKRRKGAKQ